MEISEIASIVRNIEWTTNSKISFFGFKFWFVKLKKFRKFVNSSIWEIPKIT